MYASVSITTLNFSVSGDWVITSSIGNGHLPLLPQSAQEMSSSGFFSRFCSFVPRQKLQIGIGSATGCVRKTNKVTQYIKAANDIKHLIMQAFISHVNRMYCTLCGFSPHSKYCINTVTQRKMRAPKTGGIIPGTKEKKRMEFQD